MKKPKILVVDDDQEFLTAAELRLNEDYRVKTAENGEKCLSALEEGADPDVILLDREMPDLSGKEALSRIRDKGYDVGVAMLTAVEPDFDVVDMGFDDYIKKPATKDELKNTIESLIELKTKGNVNRKLFSLIVKKAILDIAKNKEDLKETKKYKKLKNEIVRTANDIDRPLYDVLDTGELKKRLKESSLYDLEMIEFFKLSSKKAMMEAEKREEELKNDEEYQEITEEIKDIKEKAEKRLKDLLETKDIDEFLKDEFS